MMSEKDVIEEQDPNEEPRSARQEYCLAMLRWGIQALREVKCANVEEYQYRLNVVGYLGSRYTAEGGTLAELQELDTAQWFTTGPNAGFPL